MRVVLIHRYFWPDTPPYATFLREIADRLALDGCDVEVLSTQPSYKPETNIARRPWRERLDHFGVHRVRAFDNSRNFIRAAVGHLSFVLLAARAVTFSKRPDVVMCSTVPPIALAVAVSIAAKLRSAKFVYHCMDLHPDVSVPTGEDPSILQRLMLNIDTATCRRSSAIVVLSEDMKKTVVARDPALEEKVVVLNNFDLRDVDEVAADDPPTPSSKLRLIFTGNLGRFQGLVEIAEAIVRSALPVELIFMGEGAAAGALRSLQQDDPLGATVTVLPHGTPSSARALMRSADLGLVSLVPGVIRSAYPSKTVTYLSEGLPLMAVIDDGCELARSVESQGLGFQTAPGDLDAFISVLERACTDRAEIKKMRESVERYATAFLDRDQVLQRWSTFVAGLADDREGVL